ncbi:MAG: hypothetical protein KDA58_06185 [Planctomycetaceae bacterium]|nr:hypothetical protein [Planctomycetaceae bacterium]
MTVVVVSIAAGSASAQHHRHGHPIVYGPTGRPYGPTQAEYQYQRRYGHPSPGSHPGDMRYVNGYPGYGISARSYGFVNVHSYSWGPSYLSVAPIGYAPPLVYQQVTPALAFPQPGTVLNWDPRQTQLPSGAFSAPMTDPTFSDPAANNADQRVGQLIATPVPPVQQVVPESTPEQQIQAIRLVDRGDQDLRKIHYATAALDYRHAVAAARDQAVPRFRLALTDAARSRFREAIDNYKLGLQLDPSWPLHAEPLADLLGDNTLARKYLIHRVADWVAEDIRDPDRLFLLGVILHQDGDERSRDVLNTALALAGPAPHLTPFFAETVTPASQPVDPLPQPFAPLPQPAQPLDNTPPPIPVPPVDSVPEQLTPVPPGSGPLLPQRVN